jgi:hypothetical protein
MMPTPFGRLAALRLAFVCAFLIVACSTGVFSAPDTTAHPREVVLFVGHLDFDCIPDTVTGWQGEGRHFLPHAIKWGRPRVILQRDSASDRIDTLLPDSACLGAIPLGKRVAVTTILYPSWERLNGSVAFQRMNPDSLNDMLLYLWGSAGDSAERHDTLRPILVFGQQGLDTLAELDLGAVAAFQASPFFAMELRKGSELVEPAVRDLSGTISYVLAPIALNFGDREHDSLTELPPLPGDSVPAQPIRVVVYPNPIGATAQLRVDSLPAGDYTVDVVAVNGLLYMSMTMTVPEGGPGLETLDLHALPVGYYVLRIRDAIRVFGIYPIVVAR